MGFRDLFNVSDFKATVIDLIEAKIQLKKLEIQERGEQVFANLVYNFIVFLVSILVFIFALSLLGYFINLWLGSPWGYVINLAITLLLLLIIITQKVTVKAKIQEKVSEEMEKLSD